MYVDTIALGLPRTYIHTYIHDIHLKFQWQKLFMAFNMSVIFYVLILVCHLVSASANGTFQAVSCPGDVLTTECVTMGGGFTLWQGTAFQCVSTSNVIILRHSQFGGLYNPAESCNNGAIVARAIGVVNGSYTSQLKVTVSLELNDTTVKCVHLHWYNLTDTVIKRIQIIVLATGKQEEVQNCHCICVHVDIKVKGHGSLAS